MTEAEWLAGVDPDALLDEVKDKASQRKLRLYFVACCERVSHLFVDAKSRSALGCARRFADGLANTRELGQAGLDASDAWGTALVKAGTKRYDSDAATNAAKAVMAVTDVGFESYGKNAAECAFRAIESEGGPEAAARERVAQCALLREIFGNPFRPPRFSPQWRTSDAVALAKQMYSSREFDAMPILADALQDAGCDNEDVLSHCRDASLLPGEPLADSPDPALGAGTPVPGSPDPPPHVRGCWVVDLVLGKG